MLLQARDFQENFNRGKKKAIQVLDLWSPKTQFEDSPFLHHFCIACSAVFAGPRLFSNSPSNVSYKELNL
jgi:hypothetical protein